MLPAPARGLPARPGTDGPDHVWLGVQEAAKSVAASLQTKREVFAKLADCVRTLQPHMQAGIDVSHWSRVADRPPRVCLPCPSPLERRTGVGTVGQASTQAA